VARAHRSGEVLAAEHTAEGTALHARVDHALAAELTPYLLTGRPVKGHLPAGPVA
jgi:GTP-binding protein HflX